MFDYLLSEFVRIVWLCAGMFILIIVGFGHIFGKRSADMIGVVQDTCAAFFRGLIFIVKMILFAIFPCGEGQNERGHDK